MNDSLIPYAIVTAIATMVGALGSLGVSKLMSSGLKSSTKKLFVGLLSGVQWPFRLGAAAIKEWRRVSVYRHRPITWDDLPQKSKDNVRLHDLSKDARASIRLADLPFVDKRHVLDDFIFPKLFGTQHDGSLSLLDERNHITLAEESRVTFPSEEDYLAVDQDGMLLSLLVAFPNPETEIAFHINQRIGFTSRYWTAAGNIRRRYRESPGAQRVEVRVTIFSYGRLSLFVEPG